MLEEVAKPVTLYDEIIQRMPLMLIAYVLFFVVLAVWKKVYPHTALIAVLAIASLLTFLMLVNEEWVTVIAIADTVLAIVAAIDLYLLPGRKAFAIEREVARVASLKKAHRVTLLITNTSRSTRHV